MAYNNYKDGVKFKRRKLEAATNDDMGRNRLMKQPAIKKQDFDTGQKGAKPQGASLPKNPSGAAIATTQKDNTVSTAASQKFSPNVNTTGQQITTKQIKKKAAPRVKLKASVKVGTDGNGLKPINSTKVVKYMAMKKK